MTTLERTGRARVNWGQRTDRQYVIRVSGPMAGAVGGGQHSDERPAGGASESSSIEEAIGDPGGPDAVGWTTRIARTRAPSLAADRVTPEAVTAWAAKAAASSACPVGERPRESNRRWCGTTPSARHAFTTTGDAPRRTRIRPTIGPNHPHLAIPPRARRSNSPGHISRSGATGGVRRRAGHTGRGGLARLAGSAPMGGHMRGDGRGGRHGTAARASSSPAHTGSRSSPQGLIEYRMQKEKPCGGRRKRGSPPSSESYLYRLRTTVDDRVPVRSSGRNHYEATGAMRGTPGLQATCSAPSAANAVSASPALAIMPGGRGVLSGAGRAGIGSQQARDELQDGEGTVEANHALGSAQPRHRDRRTSW